MAEIRNKVLCGKNIYDMRFALPLINVIRIFSYFPDRLNIF